MHIPVTAMKPYGSKFLNSTIENSRNKIPF